MSFLLSGIQYAYQSTLSSTARRFNRSLMDPERYQLSILRKTLRRNMESLYGQEYNFASIRSIKDYQSKVPIIGYEELSPWIDFIGQGESNILTCEPVVMLEPTGGSTATNKYIPYTKTLLKQFRSATEPWISSIYQKHSLMGSTSYWSLSLTAQGKRNTKGGVKIGFNDDSEYFDPISRWALRKIMAVPASVAEEKTMDAWRNQTCIHLLGSENLGLISIWSPTYIIVLLEYIFENLDHLLLALPRKRQRQITVGIKTHGHTARALWPSLTLVSTWTDSVAAQFLPALHRWFPGISIQGKGLLATEGVISVPINDATATSENPYGRCAVAVNSHFLEFIDLENPSETPLLAHQLKTGAYYSPLLSTGGGLYRYHLKDTIKCTGTHGHTPIIRFEGKLDRVSDVCGEKIHAQQVEIGLRKACIDLDVKHDFMMLSPSLLSAPPSYCLYIDSESSDNTLTQLAKQLDRFLCKGHHYKLCQDLNQLAPICVKRVSDGWQKYQRTLIASGQRMGDIKPTFLEYRHDWSLIFD